MIITDFQKQAVILALKKMFNGSHFSICTIDTCLKVTGAVPPKADYDALHALHCVDWADMPREFRDQVFVKTLELFSHSDFPLDQIEAIGYAGDLKALQ